MFLNCWKHLRAYLTSYDSDIRSTVKIDKIGLSAAKLLVYLVERSTTIGFATDKVQVYLKQELT